MCYKPLLFSIYLLWEFHQEMINMPMHMNFILCNSSNSIYDNCSVIPTNNKKLILTTIWIITSLPIYIWSTELARFNFYSGVCLSSYWLFVPFCYLWLCNLHLLNDPECLENRKRFICYKNTPIRKRLVVKH